QHLANTLGDARIKLVGRHDRMNEPDFSSASGLETGAGQEQIAGGGPSDFRQREGRDHRRQNPELHFGESKHGPFFGHDDIADGGKARPPPSAAPWTRPMSGIGNSSRAANMRDIAIASRRFSSSV